jgi:hypothetical protein
MKKQFGLWIFCFAFFPVVAFAADIDPEIHAHCDKIADHDLNIKNSCVEEQEKAKHWLESRRIPDEVRLDCRVFSKGDWLVKKACVEKQEKEMANTVYEGSFSSN